MSKKVIITDLKIADEKIRLSGLVSEQRLLEVRCEHPGLESILGNVYIGRVQNIVNNIKAAFIEISPGICCYYSLDKDPEAIFVKKLPSPGLVQGDELLVQIQREGVKTKSPTVTSNINLTGRYVVLTSGNHKIGVSAKLNKAAREHYHDLLDREYHGEFGVIIRTNAQTASDEEILAEINRLSVKFSDMIKKAKTRTCFSCVYKANSKYMTYIQNSYQEGLSEIVTDLPEIFSEIAEYRQQYPALQEIPVRLYEDDLLPLAKLYNLEQQIQHALAKKVWLKSGGYLVIEPTEALTVIDVNSGKSMSKKEPEKHYLKINQEAALEIAFQLRLRNISGIIIIDFIDLASAEDRKAVMDELKSAVKGDPVPVQVLDMTKLNLVEVTRKKIEKSLMEQLT